MGRPLETQQAADYQAVQGRPGRDRRRRPGRPAPTVRRGDLRGRGEPGRDQPARPRHREPGPRRPRPASRPWWSATSTGAASSPISTAPWPSCPRTCARCVRGFIINMFRGDPRAARRRHGAARGPLRRPHPGRAALPARPGPRCRGLAAPDVGGRARRAARSRGRAARRGGAPPPPPVELHRLRSPPRRGAVWRSASSTIPRRSATPTWSCSRGPNRPWPTSSGCGPAACSRRCEARRGRPLAPGGPGRVRRLPDAGPRHRGSRRRGVLRARRCPGLGWLPLVTRFEAEKTTRLRQGTGPGGVPVERLRDPPRSHHGPGGWEQWLRADEPATGRVRHGERLRPERARLRHVAARPLRAGPLPGGVPQLRGGRPGEVLAPSGASFAAARASDRPRGRRVRRISTWMHCGASSSWVRRPLRRTAVRRRWVRRTPRSRGSHRRIPSRPTNRTPREGR